MSEKFQLVLDVAQKAQVPPLSLPVTLGGMNPNPEATGLLWIDVPVLVHLSHSSEVAGIHGFLMNLWLM